MRISKLSLINADTDQQIAGYEDLANNVALDLAKLGTSRLSIVATTSPTKVGSVQFTLNGQVLQTENNAPYSIKGDAPRKEGRNYFPWTPTAGSHTLIVTPFSAAGGKGNAGAPLTLSFTVGGVGSTPAPGPTVAPAPNQPPGATQITLELPVPPDPPAGQAAPEKDKPCPEWVHAAYVALAPNGKLYPTWHPPTDPKYGCVFDHEHGMDPRTWSHFKEVGFPPFGYVNDVEGSRKEDHVGNKVFHINDDTTGCSVMAKLHQGTHSPDAFQNNLHELHYHVRCGDGRRIDLRVLASFGASGEFTRGCISGLTTLTTHEQKIKTGEPTNDIKGGNRLIPGPECFALPDIPYEAWQAGLWISKKDGGNLAYVDPIFAVFNPSRYFEPGQSNNLGRSSDRCRNIQNALLLPECYEMREQPNVGWDSVQNTFKGDRREWYVGQKWTFNNTQTNVWYCDPYGRNAQTEPFPGSVPVYISGDSGFKVDGYTNFNRDFVNGGPGVKAPN
jgi:hypothetical protein